MGHFLTASIFLIALVYGVQGQVCSSILPSECYYTGAGTIPSSSLVENQYYVIGGLFNIHKKGTDSFCGAELSQEGMLNMLAFFWSVAHFENSRPNKGVSVGAIAFDNCMRPDQTVENVLGYHNCKFHVLGLNQQNLVAYVGPYTNEDSYRTGMLAQNLKVTLISPAAFSPSLNTKDQKTLLRMRPGFEYDLKAMVQFLKNMEVEYVMVVYSKSMPWTSIFEKLSTMITEQSICNNFVSAIDEDLPDDKIDDQLDEAAKEVTDRSSAKYVIPLMSKTMTKKFMQYANKKELDSLIYILHSEIGRDRDHVAENSIIVEPQIPAGNELNEFSEHLSKIINQTISDSNFGITSLKNPWFTNFKNSGMTLPDLRNAPSPMVMNVWRTIESVKTIMNGMDKGINDRCASSSQNNYNFCDQLRNLPGHQDVLHELIKGSSFGTDGQPTSVSYSYYIFKDHVFKEIGNFENDIVKIEDLKNRAEYGESFSGSVCPTSLEDECCRPPTTAAPTQDPVTQGLTLPPTTEKVTEEVLVSYPKDKEITGAFADLDESDRDYELRFDNGQKWIIALGCLAGLGILCVLVFEIFILYKMLGSHLGNKWRTMWLGQLLLFGILLSYLVCFAYLFIPTKATCGITRFGVGVSYAICFAVLLVKLMVILTSKSSESLVPGDMESPNYLKGIYQFLMFTFAVGVQVVINVQWLITVPPEAVKATSSKFDGVEWICNHYTWKTGKDMFYMDDFVRSNFDNHLMSLIYIMLMILIITILSLHAHGIITNHRESVFIGIAAGFSIPLWLAWGLVGGLNEDKDYGHEFGDACMAFGLFLTATLILFTMFLPKVRQLVNMGVEGIYLEDDRDTIYGGSVIMAPPSYKGKGPSSVIYVNNQGIYSEPVVISNGDTNKMATHLKHPGSTYSAPPTYLKKTESTYGGSRVLRVTDDLKGRHPSTKQRKPLSEVNYATSGRPKSQKGTLPRSRSQSDLGAL